MPRVCCSLRRTLATHYAPEATLYHPLTRATDRDSLYHVFRAYTFNFASDPVFREVVVQVGAVLALGLWPCHDGCGGALGCLCMCAAGAEAPSTS